MEEVDKGCPMIWMGVSGWVFLLVPAYPGSPGPTAVKRLCVCAVLGAHISIKYMNTFSKTQFQSPTPFWSLGHQHQQSHQMRSFLCWARDLYLPTANKGCSFLLILPFIHIHFSMQQKGNLLILQLQFRILKWNFTHIWSSHHWPSVLWRCWLGSRKGIRPVKNWLVGCWRGYLSGARCRLAYGPADATDTHCLLLQKKSRLVLPFWYRLTRVVPDKGPLNGCMYVRIWSSHLCSSAKFHMATLTSDKIMRLEMYKSRNYILTCLKMSM